MKPSEEQLEILFRLKRHERFDVGYLDDFLREFHGRRRLSALRGENANGFLGKFIGHAGDRIVNLAGFGFVLIILVVLVATYHFALKYDHDGRGARYSQPSAPVFQQTEQLRKLEPDPSESPHFGDQEF